MRYEQYILSDFKCPTFDHVQLSSMDQQICLKKLEETLLIKLT